MIEAIFIFGILFFILYVVLGNLGISMGDFFSGMFYFFLVLLGLGILMSTGPLGLILFIVAVKATKDL